MKNIKISSIAPAIFLVCLMSCKSTAILSNDDYRGVFRKVDSGIRISLSDSTFTVVGDWKHVKTPFTCCDTITYGDWYLMPKERLLVFDNTNYLDGYLKSNITAGIEKKYEDSIVIVVNSPLENDFYGKDRSRDIFYLLEIETEDWAYDSRMSIGYSQNVIKLYNPNHYKVKSITLYVKPNYNYKGRYFAERWFSTTLHELGNNANNVFEINIPDLTYPYLNYLRLKKDLIRIIDKNNLEWNGEIYKRE
jgi:hypothetical protein